MSNRLRGKPMKQTNAHKKRKELENKLAIVFKSEVQLLPSEYREIIVDDLVTAFENRLFALSRAQSNSDLLTTIKGEGYIETQ
jgi:hypothetical protein